jgi:hypothetical protein
VASVYSSTYGLTCNVEKIMWQVVLVPDEDLTISEADHWGGPYAQKRTWLSQDKHKADEARKPS